MFGIEFYFCKFRWKYYKLSYGAPTHYGKRRQWIGIEIRTKHEYKNK